MQFERQILPLAGAVVLATMVGGCAADSGHRTAPTRDDLTLPEALDRYWSSQSAAAGSLADLEAIFAQVEAGFIAGDDVSATVEQYAESCENAAETFEDLLDLEAAIVPYGEDKGYFGESSRRVVADLYTAAAEAVERSGERVRTTWVVVAGQLSLREAVRDRHSGVPALGPFVDRLTERIAARDAAVEAAILADDDHGGLVPLDLLAGATPADRLASYRDLGDGNVVKLLARGHVPRWDIDERAVTLELLRLAAREEIRSYALADAPPAALEALAGQLLAPAQDRDDLGTVQATLADADSGAPLAAPSTIVLRRAGLSAVAVLTGVAPQLTLDLPVGSYQIVTIAPRYLRAVAEPVVAGGESSAWPFALHDHETHPLILESLSVDTPVVGAGETATLNALAVSTRGRALTFAWTVDGPAPADLAGAGPAASLVATTPGSYAVTLAVGDGDATATETAYVEVLPAVVRVVDVAVGDGALADGALNPGEQATLTLTLAGHAEAPVAGVAGLTGLGGVRVIGASSAPFTLAAGETAAWPVEIAVPSDHDATSASLAFTFTLEDRTLQQPVAVPVAFVAELAPISSPVTSRVLHVTGQVTHPSLTTAWLVVDRDPGQVHEVHLVAGAFNQDILLQGTGRLRNMALDLVADCGSRRATDRVSFTANIPAAGLRVCLTWDTPETDVDLWVTDPNGERCYYAHRTTGLGLMLDVDDVTGWGPENITVVRPGSGDYLVQVHYYDDWDGAQHVPSTCQIAIWQDEGTDDERVTTYSGVLGETGDLWSVAVVTVGEDKAAEPRPGVGLERRDTATLPTKP